MRVIGNIIEFFKKFFIRPKQLKSGEFDENVNNNQEESFMNSLKKDNKEYLNKKSILDEIDKNPELIDKLSYSRLVQLNSLYEEKINELKIKISEIS